MNERTRNIVVGLTALTGLAAIAVLLTLFGYLPRFLDKSYVVTVQMPDSGGINSSTRVWLHGIDIGQVEEVKLLPLPQRGVQVVMRIRHDVQLPRESHVFVDKPVVGTASLSVDFSNLSEDKLKDLAPTDGTAKLLPSHEAPSLQSAMASELGKALEKATDKLAAQLDEPKKRLNEMSEKFGKLSDEWKTVGQNLNQLFAQRTPEQVDQGQGPGNLATVLARADSRMAELKHTIDSVNEWINDPKMKEDLKATLANAAKASARADATLDKIEGAVQSATKNVDTVTKRVVAVADDLSGSLDSMKAMIEQARNGKGTVGKLINDPVLYDSLTETVQRVGKVLDEVKLLIDKWKKEGMPITY